MQLATPHHPSINGPAVTLSEWNTPGELRPSGSRARRGTQVRLCRKDRRHGRACVLGASVGDAGHVGDPDRSRADEAEPKLQM